MAGDWIKVEHVTVDKPEVYRIANMLGITPEDAFGRCVRIWIWADQQSLDGHGIGVTFVTLDSIARRDGFAEAMRIVEWLVVEDDETITFPNFDRHNGKTAKNRVLANERKRKERFNRDTSHDDVATMSRSERDKPVTREEKRREETPPIIPPGNDDLNEWIEKWWARYPRYRRGSKGPVVKKLRSILTRKKATRQELDAGLDRYLAAGYGDSASACGAAVFLNQERWTIDAFPPPIDKQDQRQAVDDCEPLSSEERERLELFEAEGRV